MLMGRPDHFALIDAAQAADLDHPAERAVLLALALRADWHTGECFPTIDHLAAATLLGERHVRRVIDRLVTAGHISRTKRHHRATIYTVHPLAPDPRKAALRAGQSATPKTALRAGQDTPKPAMRAGQTAKAALRAGQSDAKADMRAKQGGHEGHQTTQGTGKKNTTPQKTPMGSKSPPALELFESASLDPDQAGSRNTTERRRATGADDAKPDPQPDAKPKPPPKAQPRAGLTPADRLAIVDAFEPVLSATAQRRVDGWPPGRLEAELEAWKDWHRTYRRPCFDFQASFRTWIKSADEGKFSHAAHARAADQQPDAMLVAYDRFRAAHGLDR